MQLNCDDWKQCEFDTAVHTALPHFPRVDMLEHRHAAICEFHQGVCEIDYRKYHPAMQYI